MKVQKPVFQDKIPPRKKGVRGRRTNPKYDAIAEQVKTLGVDQAIPIVCDTQKEVTTIVLCMKRRKLHAEFRGLTVYVSKPKATKKTTKK